MRPIDADALLRRVERWRDIIVDTYGKNDEYANCLAEVVMKIEDAPTIDVPDRKVGKWKMNSNYPDMLVCSECDGHFDCWHWEIAEMHYCPNCGARMKGEE